MSAGVLTHCVIRLKSQVWIDQEEANRFYFSGIYLKDMIPTRITVDEIKERMDRGEPFTFIDTRNPKAWGESDEKLPGAIRVPADEVEKHLAEIPKDKVVVSYCT